MNNNFKLKIGSQVLDNLISYPISIKYRNLNGARDEFTVPLFKTAISKPFAPHQTVELQWLDGDSLTDIFYGILVSDHIEKMGVLDLYNHSLTVLEYSHYLTLFISPNITHTNRRNKNVSIYDIYERVVLVNRREYRDMRPFELDEATANILKGKQAPEFTFARMTLYEIIETLFSYCEISPRFSNFGRLSHIEPLNVQEAFGRTNPFVSMEETYDPQTMNTTLVADISNMEVSETIADPAFGYKTVRSSDGFEISEDNAMIETALPIANIEDVRLNLRVVASAVILAGGKKSKLISESTIPSHMIYNSLVYDRHGNILEGIENQSIIEKSAYDALPNDETASGKGRKIYFETGKPNILGLTSRSATKWSWIPNKQAMTYIVRRFWGEKTDSGPSAILGRYDNPTPFWSQYDDVAEEFRRKAFLELAGRTEFTNLLEADYQASFRLSVVPIDDISANNLGTFFYGNESDMVNASRIRDLEFQVDYKAYVDSKIYNYREQNTRLGTSISTQSHSQITNTTSNLLYGELLDRISRANSGFDKTIRYMIKDSGNILKIGARAGDYIITGGLLNINKTHINATYSFDEFYAKINHYIGLREQWRQFEIPTENILTQQATTGLFAKIVYDVEGADGKEVKGISHYLGNKKLDNLTLTSTTDRDLGPTVETPYILSAISYPFNNTIVAEASTQDNNLIGSESEMRRKDNNELELNKRFNSPNVIDYGEIKDLSFNTTISRPGLFDNKLDGHMLPRVRPEEANYAAERFVVPAIRSMTKDARERIKWSLQIHHVDETGEWYINPSFVALNGLVGGPGLGSENLKVVMLDFKPHDTTRISTNSARIISTNNAEFNLFDDSYIELPRGFNTSQNSSVSMAIALENSNHYEILLWQDIELQPGEQSQQAYIVFDSVYRREDRLFNYTWELFDGVILDPDYKVATFEDLPAPFSDGLTAKLGYTDWEEVSPHNAELGFIVAEKIPYGPTGTKAITTGFELVGEGSSVFDSTKEIGWTTGEALTYEPNYTARFLKDLPQPQRTTDTARVVRTDWQELSSTPPAVSQFYSKVEDLPDTEDLNLIAVATNYDLVETTDYEYNSAFTWSWREEAGILAPYTYDVKKLSELPEVSNSNYTARVSNLEWNSRSFGDAEKGFIAPTRAQLRDTLESGRKAIITAYDLEPSSLSEWDAGQQLLWSQVDTGYAPYQYDVNSIVDLPAPSVAQLRARVHNLTWTDATPQDANTDYYKGSKNDLPSIDYKTFGEGPKTITYTKHKLDATNRSAWDANTSYTWVEGGDPIDADYTVKYIEDLPPASWNKRGRVFRNNLTPVNPSASYNTKGYIAATEAELKVSLYPYSVTNHAVITGYNLVEIDTTSTYLFTLDLAYDSPTKSEIWDALYEQQYQSFNEISQLSYYNFRVDNGFGYTYWKVEGIDGSPDNPEYYKIGSVRDRSYISVETNSPLNVEIYTSAGAAEHDIWNQLRLQQPHIFYDLQTYALNNTVIRADDGQGYLYFKISKLPAMLNYDIEYGVGNNSIKYYLSTVSNAGERVTINIQENFTMADVWFELQQQEKQIFHDMGQSIFGGIILRYDNGFSYTYYKPVNVPGSEEYLVSSTNVKTYRAHKYVPQNRLEFIVNDAFNESDIWLGFHTHYTALFRDMGLFHFSGGVMKVDDGLGNKYFKVEPVSNPTSENPQYFGVAGRIDKWYAAQTTWGNGRLFLDAPEGYNRNDVWFIMQEDEGQTFNNLELFAAMDGRIRVDSGFGYDYYRLEAVDGATEGLRYFVATQSVIEYYKSKILL